MNNNWPRLSVDGIECQKPPKTGGLYLFTFQEAGMVKLGATTDFDHRLSDLTKLSPFSSSLLHFVMFAVQEPFKWEGLISAVWKTIEGRYSHGEMFHMPLQVAVSEVIRAFTMTSIPPPPYINKLVAPTIKLWHNEAFIFHIPRRTNKNAFVYCIYFDDYLPKIIGTTVNPKIVYKNLCTGLLCNSATIYYFQVVNNKTAQAIVKKFAVGRLREQRFMKTELSVLIVQILEAVGER